MMELAQPLVFLSYATPDRARVKPLYDFLTGKGLNVWMDKPRIKPGQNWDFEIRSALSRAVIVLVFLSKVSVDRRGYVQREMRIALDMAEEKLTNDIYLIPILLDDDVRIPDELKQVQHVKASDVDYDAQIEEAIRLQLTSLGIKSEEVQDRSQVRWQPLIYKEKWEGVPGYDVEFSWPDLTSKSYGQIGEITAIIKGAMFSHAAEQRAAKMEQSPEHYNFGQAESRRTNWWSAHHAEPSIVGKVISIHYAVHYYFSGAAHPNVGFLAFVFVLDPIVRINQLDHLFLNPTEALGVIRDNVRSELNNINLDDYNGGHRRLDSAWIERGTETWADFASFAFRQDGIDIHFAPYTVSCYADGPQIVTVPYERFAGMLRPAYRSALGLDHL